MASRPFTAMAASLNSGCRIACERISTDPFFLELHHGARTAVGPFRASVIVLSRILGKLAKYPIIGCLVWFI